MQKGTCIICLSILLNGCGTNPQNADFGLDLTLPEDKVTIYQQAINKIGLMTTIYSSTPVTITVTPIFDNTGTSIATSAEIPRDVTEMVKSTLNAIGGNVMYIPHEPVFMKEAYTLDINDFKDKIKPQVALTGGITEFDRGLVTKGDSIESDAEIGKIFGLDFSDQIKASLSSVTLDFNLIDMKTFAGIPRVQAVNGIKLHKGTRSDSIGFTVKSVTFGAKGEITKVQGRHAAVRMLVQLSMLQMIGRYMNLPYWQLVPGAVRDDVVIDRVLADYYDMTQWQQIYKAQELLYLHGYSVTPSGRMDASTQNALQSFTKKEDHNSIVLDQNLYLALYESVPITPAARQLRRNLSNPKAIEAMVQPIALAPRPVRVADETTRKEQSSGRLTLSTNKSEFRIGETLKINFAVNEPMYVRIVVINSKGEVSTLFPNAYQSDNYCLPGKNYSVPPSTSADFSLDIGEPVGIDKLRAVASRNPIPADHLHFTVNGDFDEKKMALYTVRGSANYVVVR